MPLQLYHLRTGSYRGCCLGTVLFGVPLMVDAKPRNGAKVSRLPDSSRHTEGAPQTPYKLGAEK